jgi:hypothetical protein
MAVSHDLNTFLKRFCEPLDHFIRSRLVVWAASPQYMPDRVCPGGFVHASRCVAFAGLEGLFFMRKGRKSLSDFIAFAAPNCHEECLCSISIGSFMIDKLTGFPSPELA